MKARRARLSLWAMLGIASLSTHGEVPESSAPSGVGLEVTAWTIDGGGGYSSGGSYTLVASIGQADADPLHPSMGGDYSLVGGFLPAGALTAMGTDALFADGFED